ncbi:MAG: hypothetical protein K6D38_08120 [Pseudobutyrivibrio sp.]|nr:hypothetical protein [Pseudobutyrivibrio sp.]
MATNNQELYEKFIGLQREVHLKNQKKIRVGLKINILLPLIFLVISFVTERSKLVFLVLWIVSLFGIAFYLLYVEYMDFKIQEQLKELGILDNKGQSLIGDEVVKNLDDISQAGSEMVRGFEDIRKGIKTDIRNMGDKLKK